MSWTLGWTVTVVQRGSKTELRSATPTQRVIQGSVRGDAVRDFCDEPDEGLAEVGPDWPGTTQCDGPMQTCLARMGRGHDAARSRTSSCAGRSSAAPRGRASSTCATTSSKRPSRSSRTRPDASRDRVRASRWRSARATRAPRKSYVPTRLCSHFPHVYDGIVYLYDCEDTLTWDGSVTLTRIR